ncbi:MAG: helix-turn-helix transcriptional regulator [Verrucomicrobiales bacterium]|nr:helix-turn-helix transcriptional regulator [Verrucomicrobiales bacterium]
MDSSPRYERFRSLLRQIRVDAGMTQVELAEKLGKLQSYVSKAELGERRLDFLEALDYCEACGVTVEELIAELKTLPED